MKIVGADCCRDTCHFEVAQSQQLGTFQVHFGCISFFSPTGVVLEMGPVGLLALWEEASPPDIISTVVSLDCGWRW